MLYPVEQPPRALLADASHILRAALGLPLSAGLSQNIYAVAARWMHDLYAASTNIAAKIAAQVCVSATSPTA